MSGVALAGSPRFGYLSYYSIIFGVIVIVMNFIAMNFFTLPVTNV
jgi:hypothetical protein